MKRKLMLSLVALGLALDGASPVATATDWCSGGVCQEWVARYDGPVSGHDSADDLAVDGSGNVYVTGGSSGSGSGYDFVTIKYGPDGSEEWVARYNGEANGDDWPEALAVDVSGNVYVTGESAGFGTAGDYTTIKYGPDGSEEWVARYDGPAGGSDEAHALAVDGSGSVYVTGHSQGSGTGLDYATIKYRPDGSEEWVARYDGPANMGDGAVGLAVDRSGSVYVTGSSVALGPPLHSDYATIKYGPDGTEQWVARYDGPAGDSDQARNLTTDNTGAVYVTGYSFGSATDKDYATVKYGPDGSEEWVARYDGPASGLDAPHALAVDGSGNVYVTGTSPGLGTDRDYATIKYGPDGQEEWTVRYDGPVSSVEQGNSLAVDTMGNVYVTGYSRGFSTDFDYATIKYGPDGSEQWVARYDGPASGSDSARGLGVDGSGNVYVTGGSDGDYATIKYVPDSDADGDGCTGEEELPGAPAPKPGSTGAYDPLNPYDFYDVPVPAVADPDPNGVRNGAIEISDVLAVLFYAGADAGGPANGNGVDYDSVKGSCDIDGDTVADKEGLCYDRTPGPGPNPPWDAGPPDGAISITDVLAVLAQSGLDCSGPP